MSEDRLGDEQDNYEESPEVIRAEIESTRIEMSGTIDAIQERLAPEVVKAQIQEVVQERTEEVKEHVQAAITEHVDHVKSQVRDATIGRVETMVNNVSDGMRGSGGRSFFDTVRANPIPTALVGIGLGLLFSKHRNEQTAYRTNSPRDYRYDRDYRTTNYGDGRYRTYGYENDDQSMGDRLGDTVGGARDRVGQIADTAGDRVSDFRDQAADRVGDFRDQAADRVGDFRDEAGNRVNAVADQAQQTAMQAKSTFQQQLEENPLAIGAVAIAVGLAAGMSLPGTPIEDQTFGEARDNLVGQVQAKAQDTLQKVQQVAQDVQQNAVQTAKESAQQQGLAQTTS